tara:strand:+ start:4348 stop:5616 length:1269 start_codon:yes stop_codon:yes gene_type:complete
MSKNKLLIISYYWPPSGGSGVQRWLNFSNNLVKKGWEITIFTAKNANYPIIDNGLNSIVDKSIKVFRIPILEPTHLFKKNNSNHINSSSFIMKFILWIRANIFFPDSRMFWIKKVTKKASNYIKQNNINCLITTAPPFSTHIIGLKIKKNTNIKWISDFRDPWSDFFQFKLLPMTSNQRIKHSNFENKCLSFSDAVITTSPSLTKRYSVINSNSHTITNGFNSFKKNIETEKFLIMYSGVMKSIQNPKNLWKVLKEICIENQDFSNDLMVRFIGDFHNEISKNDDIKLIESKVEFESYIEKSKLDIEMSKANVLVLASVNLNDVNNIIPGKLFYYFSFKRPIIAFSNLNSDVADIISKSKTGKVFDFMNHVDLKNHILELYSDYRSKTNNFNPSGLASYSYKNLSEKIDALLKKQLINGDSN